MAAAPGATPHNGGASGSKRTGIVLVQPLGFDDFLDYAKEQLDRRLNQIDLEKRHKLHGVIKPPVILL